MTTYKCPVCFYPDMEEPAQDFNICCCCGTEFGNDDWNKSHAALRAEWIKNGMPWFFGNHPEHWSPNRQLALRSVTTEIVIVGLCRDEQSAFPNLSGNQSHAHFSHRTSTLTTVENVEIKGLPTNSRILVDDDFAFAS